MDETGSVRDRWRGIYMSRHACGDFSKRKERRRLKGRASLFLSRHTHIHKKKKTSMKKRRNKKILVQVFLHIQQQQQRHIPNHSLIDWFIQLYFFFDAFVFMTVRVFYLVCWSIFNFLSVCLSYSTVLLFAWGARFIRCQSRCIMHYILHY